MAVAVDATGTGGTAAATTLFTEGAATITVGVGANRVLALLIQFGAVVSNVAPSWDAAGSNKLMTRVVSSVESDNLASTYIFGLIAPASGAKLLKVSWIGSASYTYGMISFTGADQGSVAGTFRNFQSGNPAAAITPAGYPTGGVNVNCPVGDFCILGAASNNRTLDNVNGQVGTNLYALTTNVSGAAVYTTGAGASTNLTIGCPTHASTDPACWTACDIAAVGTVAAPTAQVCL